MLKKLYFRLPIYVSPLGVLGCGSNEEAIIGLGFLLVLIFLVCWGLSMLLPKIQNTRWLKDLIKKLRSPLRFISTFLMIIFAIAALAAVFTSEGVFILFGAVFGIGMIGVHYLKKWAESEDGTDKKIELKMIVLSITFIIALIWLIYFGGSFIRF